MTLLPTTVLSTDRLEIRDWTERPADLARIWDIYSRWEVMRFLGAAPKVMADRAEAQALAQRWSDQHTQWDNSYGAWAIEDRASRRVAGTVLFKPMPNSDGSPARDIEVGWHLHPDSWGHGYATEAARAVIERGFAAGLTEVYAVVNPENIGSQAVCRRLGMEPLGGTERWYGLRCLAFRLARTDSPVAG